MKGRIEVLDSLRGIACCQVVFGHFLSALGVFESKSDKNIWNYLENSPVHFFWNGSGAVILFFVLSGFVLSIPFAQNTNNNYAKYFIKRTIRLYLPCAAIITISLLCFKLLYKEGDLVGFGGWLRSIWAGHITTDYIRELYLFTTHFVTVDPALWTLPVELKLSLLLPFIFFLLKKTNKFWSWAMLFIYIALYHVVVQSKILQAFPFFQALYFLSFFILGALLYKYEKEFVGFFNKLSQTSFYVLFAITILLSTVQSNVWWLSEEIQTLVKIKFTEYLSGLSSILFLGFALSERFHKLLISPILVWLGKISFSLYLTHMVTIAAVASVFVGRLNNSLIVWIGAILSFFIAVLFYKYVEQPSLNLAKKVASIVK